MTETNPMNPMNPIPPTRRPARRQANSQPTPPPPPATTPPPPPPEREKTGLPRIRELLSKHKEAIARVIPANITLTAEGLIQNALQMIQTHDEKRKLMLCSPSSVLYSVICAARLGLDLAGDACYLVPMAKHEKDRSTGEPTIVGHYCVAWPSYKGLVTVAARAGFFIDSQVVYENDTIEVLAGTDNRITHKIGFGSRGKMIGVYCVVRDVSARVLRIETMDNDDLDQVRQRTRVWKDWEGEMARKSVVKRAAKWLPKDHPDFRLVAALEQRVDEGKDLSDLANFRGAGDNNTDDLNGSDGDSII